VLVAARAGLLSLAVAAAVAGLRLIPRDRAGGVPAGRYVCPMHPEVAQSTPGECPLCGMALAVVTPATPMSTGASAQPVESPRYGVDTVKHHVYSQALDLAAWVESPGIVVALLYEDEVPSLKADERARFVPAALPGNAVVLELTGDPPAPWDRSTVLVRLRFEDGDANERAGARPGAVGRVELGQRLREVVVVPSSAVLHAGDSPYVLVSQRGTLTRRPIATGRSFNGLTAVVSGVAVRESVVCDNAFFMDAEQRAHPEPRAADEPLP
jgi:hypothetical protein